MEGPEDDDWFYKLGVRRHLAESVRRESREDCAPNACRFPPYPEGPWDGWLDEDSFVGPGDRDRRMPRLASVLAIGRAYGRWWGSRRRSGWKAYLKRRKAKSERRRAKLDPEAAPGHGRYRGWWW